MTLINLYFTPLINDKILNNGEDHKSIISFAFSSVPLLFYALLVYLFLLIFLLFLFFQFVLSHPKLPSHSQCRLFHSSASDDENLWGLLTLTHCVYNQDLISITITNNCSYHITIFRMLMSNTAHQSNQYLPSTLSTCVSNPLGHHKLEDAFYPMLIFNHDK